MNEKTEKKVTDDIAEKLNREADQADAEAKFAEDLVGEVITKRAESVDQERYKNALEQGRVITGWIMGGIGFVWPYVKIDDAEMLETSAKRHADVLIKYSLETAGTDAMPEWLKALMPEIRLAMLYGMTGFAIWMQVQAYKSAQAEAERKAQEEKNNGGQSESGATE